MPQWSVLKRLLKKALSKAGYEVFNSRYHHARDELYTNNHPRFMDDAAFQLAYQRGVAASQGVNPGFHWRVHIALWAAELASRVPGDFVECGVNAGFVSSAIMHHLDWRRQHRQYYLIDTFAGPPLHQYSAAEVADGRADLAKEAEARGAYVKDLERLAANFAEWPNALLVPGLIPEVLPGLAATQVAFLHIDLNCALPEREALRHFWKLMKPGAVILLDDYCYQGHGAQADAIDAVAIEIGANVLGLPTGQGLIVR